jgi:hypothetical protein
LISGASGTRALQLTMRNTEGIDWLVLLPLLGIQHRPDWLTFSFYLAFNIARTFAASFSLPKSLAA